MTPSSKKLVSPMAFQAMTLERVHHDMWEPSPTAEHDHIRLAQEGDLFLLAPATGNTIGKLAHGILDNIVATTAFAFTGPKLFAPAMNWRMWAQRAVQDNARQLQDDGWTMIPPVEGDLACGEQGPGRLAPVEDILRVVREHL